MENKWDTICSKCGNACQVPFQPKPNQTITCKTCWAAEKNRPNMPSSPVPQQSNLMSVKDINITAQCLTKCMFYNNEATSIAEVMDVYNQFVKALENNGA